MKFLKYRHHCILPEEISLILDTLNKRFKSMLVGGCVRDLLWGRPSHDYDIAYCGHLKEMLVYLLSSNYRVVETGARFGTLTVPLVHTHVELTTLRREGGFNRSHKPSLVVPIQSWEEDMSRRDLTYNSAYMCNERIMLTRLSSIDLTQRYTRFVGDSCVRIWEDPLRWYRYVRFHLRNSDQSWVWFIKKHPKPRRAWLSKERIYQEYLNMISHLLRHSDGTLLKRWKRFGKTSAARSMFLSSLNICMLGKIKYVTREISSTRVLMALFIHLILPYFNRSKLLDLLGNSVNKCRDVNVYPAYHWWIWIKRPWNLLFKAKNSLTFIVSALKHYHDRFTQRVSLVVYLNDFHLGLGIRSKITRLTYTRLEHWWLSCNYIPSKGQVNGFVKRYEESNTGGY